MSRYVVLAIWVVLPAIAMAADEKFEPIERYEKEQLEGFTLLVHPEVNKHPEEAKALRAEMQKQMQEINAVVPKAVLGKLHAVPIWVEWKVKDNGAAEYHVSAQWLRSNGYNPQKASAIEISNAKNFVSWSKRAQPWMLLHELAHAYHHQVLGEQHKGIRAAYQQAVERKLYDEVSYLGGAKQRAYALTNTMEYYAELSEAYFGKNDFYPFNRSDLAKHDPVGHQLMIDTWGEPTKR